MNGVGCLSPELISGGYEASVGVYLSSDAVRFVPDSSRTLGSWVTWYSAIIT